MAALQPALEAEPLGHAGDFDQRPRARVAAFVDMQVHVETAVDGQPEDTLQQIDELSRQRVVPTAAQPRHGAEHAAGLGHDVGQPLALGFGEGVHRHQARRLQLDSAGPRVAHGLEHRPRDFGLGRVTVEVRAHRD